MESVVLKVRSGADTYIKRDGSRGTAGKGALLGWEVAFTVAATQDQTLFDPVSFGVYGDTTPKACEEVAPTLRVGGEGGTNQFAAQPEDGAGGYVVRRLTPEECERLQGMPTGHTRIPWRGKQADECPDGPRYKAVGNSMAVPVMRWIGERIQMVDGMMGGDADA